MLTQWTIGETGFKLLSSEKNYKTKIIEKKRRTSFEVVAVEGIERSDFATA